MRSRPADEGRLFQVIRRAANRIASSPPYGTILILTLTSCVTISQFVFPEVLEALRRDPVALRQGEWWRAVTPLLVHSEGLAQFLFNVAGIAIVGTYCETRLGLWPVLAFYLAGSAAGEVAGYLWQPFGAGASVALFGLIGGIAVGTLRGQGAMPPLTGQVATGAVAAVLGNALGGPVVGAVLAMLACLPLGVLLHNRTAPVMVAWGTTLSILIAAAVLSALSNVHGPPLLVGALTGLAVASRKRGARP